MPAEMTVWSYVSQWFGYVVWCASAADPACRPFVGFLALSGACAGTLSILLVAIAGMAEAWEREIVEARAPRAQRRRERAVRRKIAAAHAASEPALGVGAAAAARPAHAEPVLPAGALAMEPLPAGPVAPPLRPVV